MTGNKAYLYHLNKMTLLRQVLHINEDFLSNLKSWESYDDFLNKKDGLFRQLKKLDTVYGTGAARSCADSQIHEIESIIDLIEGLDRDISKAIRQELLATLESIKSKTMEKKITAYTNTALNSNNGGRLIDYRK